MEQIHKKGTKGTKPRALPKTQRLAASQRRKSKPHPCKNQRRKDGLDPMEMPTTAHTLGSFIRRLALGRGDHHPDDK